MKTEPGNQWQIQGKLIDHQVFTVKKDGEIKYLLVMMIVDQQGDIIEFKTWNKVKAFTVYRKFRLEQPVVIDGNGFFREPNRNYSSAKTECYGGWWMDPLEDFRLEKFVQCVSSIDQYDKAKKPATIMGVFEDFAKELNPPARMNRSRTITLAQGVYIRCTGDNKKQFLLLVWQTPRERNPAFLNLVPGKSIVLLPYARLQAERFSGRTGNERVLTATYPIIVDPSFVNPNLLKKMREVAAPLPRGRRSQHSPASQTNGIS